LFAASGEQTTAEPPLRIELIRRLVDLKERFLEYILRRRAIAEETNEEVVKLTLVTEHEHGELALVAGAVFGQQAFVAGLVAHRPCCGRALRAASLPPPSCASGFKFFPSPGRRWLSLWRVETFICTSPTDQLLSRPVNVNSAVTLDFGS